MLAKGYANDFKPKTVQTQLGELEFSAPQVRDGGFTPPACRGAGVRLDKQTFPRLLFGLEFVRPNPLLLLRAPKRHP